MAVLTVADIIDAGLTPSLAAVSSSDSFVDDGTSRTFVEVANGGGGSINVTVPAVQTSVNVQGVGDLTIANIVVAVGAGARKFIGPFSPAYRASDGSVTLQFSGTSSVTAKPFRVAREG